jgi:lipoprotein
MMRKMIIRPLAVGLLSLALLPSCNKFLDIQSKGTLLEDVQFSTIRGYEDAMYGVYGSMAEQGLYGGVLTAGFLENISQTIGNVNNVSMNYHVNRYRYTNLRCGIRSMLSGLPSTK